MSFYYVTKDGRLLELKPNVVRNIEKNAFVRVNRRRFIDEIAWIRITERGVYRLDVSKYNRRKRSMEYFTFDWYKLSFIEFYGYLSKLRDEG